MPEQRTHLSDADDLASASTYDPPRDDGFPFHRLDVMYQKLDGLVE